MSSSNTDFDAKLIDWLYGELGSDESASFETYLETHPEHRAEAHALREMRSAFQGLPEAEPPNALTSILMQQAASAAQPKNSLWASFVGFFQPLALHPAAAAMATVVLVAGVAGTLYVRSGSMAAEPTTVSSSVQRPASAAPEPTETGAVFADDLRGGLREEEDHNSEDSEPAPRNVEGYTANIADATQEKLLRKAMEKKPAVASRAKADRNTADIDELLATSDRGGFLGANAISGGGLAIGENKSAKSNRKDGAKRATRSAPPAKPVQKGLLAQPDPVQPSRDSEISAPSWEESQLQQFKFAARGKRCKDAGRIANDLKERSPTVYKKGVKGTPEESDCSYYIASETRRRKSSRAKTAAKKGKKRATGQGSSVPNKAAAAAEDSFEETASESGTAF